MTKIVYTLGRAKFRADRRLFVAATIASEDMSFYTVTTLLDLQIAVSTSCGYSNSAITRLTKTTSTRIATTLIDIY